MIRLAKNNDNRVHICGGILVLELTIFLRNLSFDSSENIALSKKYNYASTIRWETLFFIRNLTLTLCKADLLASSYPVH